MISPCLADLTPVELPEFSPPLLSVPVLKEKNHSSIVPLCQRKIYPFCWLLTGWFSNGDLVWSAQQVLLFVNKFTVAMGHMDSRD